MKCPLRFDATLGKIFSRCATGYTHWQQFPHLLNVYYLFDHMDPQLSPANLFNR